MQCVIMQYVVLCSQAALRWSHSFEMFFQEHLLSIILTDCGDFLLTRSTFICCSRCVVQERDQSARSVFHSVAEVTNVTGWRLICPCIVAMSVPRSQRRAFWLEYSNAYTFVKAFKVAVVITHTRRGVTVGCLSWSCGCSDSSHAMPVQPSFRLAQSKGSFCV